MRMNRLPLSHRRARRRGGIYTLVMFTSLIVATLGLAAIQGMRVQGAQFNENNNFAQARLYARAAVEIGMLKVRSDPNWRTNLGNGTWASSQSIGSGTYSLSAVDPIDGDVKVGNNDPVILTATGTVGKASYSSSIRMEIGPPPGSPLEVAMTSASDTNVANANLTSNQTVSAGGKYKSTGGSNINANVESVGNPSGSGYLKATTVIPTVRPMPDSGQVFTYYSTNGTTINYSSLPKLSQLQLATNTSFETDTSNWYSYGTCTLQQSAAQQSSGATSLFVTSRANASSVAAQDLIASCRSRIQSNHQYNLSIPIYITTPCTVSTVLATTDTVNGTQFFVSSTKNITPNGQGVYSWTTVGGNITPSWSGTLTQASIGISINVANDYYMDAVSLTDVTSGYNAYMVDRVLLSPNSNPFGATNSQGIYILQCGGQQISISNSRIVGTLFIVNAGLNSTLGDSVIMEPAISDYPVLLTDSSTKLTVQLSSATSESSLGVNLNPDGTPYPYAGGASNSTLTDSYPATINGLIYSQGDLTFSGSPTINGVVIGAGQINVNATSLNLNYSNIFLMSPPPGFTGGTPVMKTVPGSVIRVTN